jgi:hypothetical protein
VEEKALRARWGARREHVEADTKGALWQGGGRLSAAKTRVGWPEEPQLWGVLIVRFRRSANTHRIAGMSQCVGCGVTLRRRAREKDAAVRRGVFLTERVKTLWVLVVSKILSHYHG